MPTDAGDTFNTSEDSMTDDTTITDSERDLLRFPGDVPGLLRRGSPICGGSVVVSIASDDVGEPYAMTARDDVSQAGGAYSDVTCEWMGDIALDLTDATGRAHLAWWIARYFLSADGPPTPGRYMQVTSSLWSFDGGAWILALLAQPERHMHGRRLTPVGATETFEFPAHGKQRHEYGVPVGWHWSSVPALATLDPDDPRLLPDGSRLVDALALSMVGRHLLAGGGR